MTDQPLATETVQGGGLIVEAGQLVPVTLAADQVLPRGTVLGRITASGHYVVSASAASDGSQFPVGVLALDADTTGAAAPSQMLTGGVYSSLHCLFGTGYDVAGMQTVLAGLGWPFLLASHGAPYRAAIAPPVTALTDPNIEAVNDVGWSITYAAAEIPAQFDLVTDIKYITVQRQGYASTGLAAVFEEDVPVTRRIRDAGQTVTLTADQAALAQTVYLDDDIVNGAPGIGHNSTRAYPLPQLMWLTGDSLCIDDDTVSFPLRIGAAHKFGMNGEPLAAVRFILSDGTNSNSALVSTTVWREWAASGLGGAVYETDAMDLLTGLDTGVRLFADAIAYPHVGEPFQISVDADAWPSPNLCPLAIVNNSDGSYGRVFAAVETGAVGGTVNEDRAAALLTPFPTVVLAAAAIKTYNNANFGRNDSSNGHIILKNAETFTHANFSASDTGLACLVLEGDSYANRLTTVFEDSGASILNGFPNNVSFRNLTLKRNIADANTRFIDSAAPRGGGHVKHFEGVHFDLNGLGASNAWAYGTGVMFLENCTGMDWGIVQNYTATVHKGANVVGCNGLKVVESSVYSAFACYGLNSAFKDNPEQTANPKGVGKLLAFCHLNQTSDSVETAKITSATEDRGFGIVCNVLEKTSDLTTPALSIHADGNTQPMPNGLVYGNTTPFSRTNGPYNETGVAAVYKYVAMYANIHWKLNKKADMFAPANAARVGTFGARYSADALYNIATHGDNDRNSVGPDHWQGEFEPPWYDFGTDGSPLDPGFTDNLSGDGNAGGGDYTPTAVGLMTLPARFCHYKWDMLGRSVPLDGTAVIGALQKAI